MLRWTESFDHYDTVGQKWDGTFNTHWLVTTGGRLGGNRGDAATDGIPDSRRGSYKNFPGTETTWIIGFGFICFSYSSGNPVLIVGGYEAPSTRHTGLCMDSTGRLVVTRGTSILETYATPLATSIWNYLEFKFTVHDTTGSYDVRLNGVSIMSDSGIDTRNGGSGFVDRINFSGGVGGGDGATIQYGIDDIYICDSVDSGVAGIPNDDFLGDVRIEACFANGNGNSSQFDGSDGNTTDNYLLVDETVPDDDTTYVESLDVGDKDTYTYTNVTPTTGTVYGVHILPRAKKTDAGSRTMKTVARLSGTEVDGPSQSLSGSYTYLPDIREAKPGGGAWTITDVNNAEFGQKVNS